MWRTVILFCSYTHFNCFDISFSNFRPIHFTWAVFKQFLSSNINNLRHCLHLRLNIQMISFLTTQIFKFSSKIIFFEPRWEKLRTVTNKNQYEIFNFSSWLTFILSHKPLESSPCHFFVRLVPNGQKSCLFSQGNIASTHHFLRTC